MPRTARQKSSTGIYHIIMRGINRQSIFEDAEDNLRFLQTLEKYKEISGYWIFAYCLMGNHIHLLLKEGLEPLEQIMRRICGSYVYWYNSKYERIGNLFQDRFKSESVEDDAYFLTVLRYIHQNPLHAGLVNEISQYRLSSYQEYLQPNALVRFWSISACGRPGTTTRRRVRLICIKIYRIFRKLRKRSMMTFRNLPLMMTIILK